MRLAVIDLGTNTFNLLIADVHEDGRADKIFKTRIPVKLGDRINDGLISPEAYERGINAIKEFREEMDQHEVEKAKAFATSAIRSSQNGEAFSREIKELTGIEVTVINGDQEAEYIYHGVNQALDLGKKPSLILDIGGGSNEFIIGTDTSILWKHSFNLGIARLLSRFNPSDPITDKELNEIRTYLEAELKDLFEAVKKYPVDELIGASGSFETFAELNLRNFRSGDKWDTETEYNFRENDLDQILSMLLRSTKEERLNMNGMLQMRSDMIVLAAVLVELVIKRCNIKSVRVSDYSLQEGVLYTILKK